MISKTDVNGAAVTAPIVARAGDRLPAIRVDVVHHLPGRLRLRSASLKGDTCASEEARTRFAQIEGVTAVTANPCTGSLLLEYDPAVLLPGNVVDELAAQGYILAGAEEGTERLTGWADRLASAIKHGLIEAFAERLAFAMISVLV